MLPCLSRQSHIFAQNHIEMNEEIQALISQLGRQTNDKEIVNTMQKVMKQLLEHYAVSVCGVMIYPLEVESYFTRNSVFEDYYVHDNDLQMNNYGRLYIHRRSRSADASYKADNRVCMGICLSDSNTYYYSTLIRSAVMQDGTKVFGPNNVLAHIVHQINEREQKIEPAFFNHPRYGSSKMAVYFPEMETAPALIRIDDNTDPRDNQNTFYATRVGLGNDNPYYRDLPLRALTGQLIVEYKYKEKKKIKELNDTITL
jgi:hypothetical protein